MPKWMQEVFWRYHGPVMEHTGYDRNGEIEDYPDWGEVADHVRAIRYQTPERLRKENILLRLTKMGLR